MSRNSKFGVRELESAFPNNKDCLQFIFNTLHSRRCSCGGVYSQRKGRKSFRCGKCRYEIAPLKGTIFEKSKTPLKLWFHALLIFSNAKSGTSAMELKRNLSVTYKCAWRILAVIRSSLVQSTRKLSGIVETDGTSLGGKKSPKTKKFRPVVQAAIERHGEARVRYVSGTDAQTTTNFIFGHVDQQSRLLTDKSMSYIPIDKIYGTEWVNHRKKEYVRGDVHLNTVESFWAHVKRSLKGTHNSVSKKHLQSYLDAFVFHYNNAYNDKKRFERLLEFVLISGARTKTSA
jgi:transposase